jgi:transposase
MRSGVQWNRLPERFGDDSSVHRTMQRWIARGVLGRVWSALVENCAELGGVNWEWQSHFCCCESIRKTLSTPMR